MKLSWFKHTSVFKTPGGTSRGVLHTKDSWILRIDDDGSVGIGEVSLIPGLSIDNPQEIETQLIRLASSDTIDDLSDVLRDLNDFPAIQFGLECALFDLKSETEQVLFPSEFTEGEQGITINGLIWMGEPKYMVEQISSKLKQGFTCLKMKIGAIDFQQELSILKQIRSSFSANDLTLRVDANGAFSPANAEKKLDTLSQFDIHSIEQPIQPNQWEHMHKLCDKNIVPIALDEELINQANPEAVLQAIQPQYIILKPSLLGGLKKSDEWISEAEKANIPWWATSALETNIGLNAIAQWCASKDIFLPQGLGTGQVFTNNFSSPLHLQGEKLFFNPLANWDIPQNVFHT